MLRWRPRPQQMVNKMKATHLKTLAGPQGEPLFDVRLAAVAVDPVDVIYVLGDDRVLSLPSDGEPGLSFAIDALGWSLLAEEDQLWVGFDGRVGCYSPEGKQLSAIKAPERLGRITSIAAAGDSLVLADSTNRAVHRYSRDGKYLGEMGAEANTRGFMIPNGVLDLASDPSSGTVVVAHPQKHRVERYAPDGPLVEKWGRFGMHDPSDFGGCCNPTNIAVATEGTIAVSEKAPPRVKLYDGEGNLELVVDQEVFDPNTKNIDLAFDSRNRLYATDPIRRVVEVFELQAE